MSVATNQKVKPTDALSATISELRDLQRERSVYIKSMTMISNRRHRIVANTMGYHTGLSDPERKKLDTEASQLIKTIVKDGQSHVLKGIVRAHTASLDSLEMMRKPIEKTMERLAKTLPVAGWVLEPAQKGFGIPSLAVVVGEAGDLSNYANPGKLWARFGCHPFEKDGETHMGATWKSRSRKPGVVKLSAEDWEAFGYSPRRRSIAYLIGENLIKQNGDGPYRRRWVEAKIRAYETHPEWAWKPCEKCKTQTNGSPCGTCGGLGQKCMQAHLHGMLLATKRLLRELWAEWNGRPDEGIWKG